MSNTLDAMRDLIQRAMTEEDPAATTRALGELTAVAYRRLTELCSRELRRFLSREYIQTETGEVLAGAAQRIIGFWPQFLAVARAAPPHALPNLFFKWCVENTRYVLLDLRRAERRGGRACIVPYPDSGDQPGAPFDPADPRPGPDAAAEGRDDLEALFDAIDRLPEDEREVINLRHFNGLTFAEIGEQLGLGEDAPRRRHLKAMHKLRARFPGLDWHL